MGPGFLSILLLCFLFPSTLLAESHGGLEEPSPTPDYRPLTGDSFERPRRLPPVEMTATDLQKELAQVGQAVGEQAIQEFEALLRQSIEAGGERALEAAEQAIAKFIEDKIGVGLTGKDIENLVALSAMVTRDPRGAMGELGRRINQRLDQMISNLPESAKTDLFAAKILFDNTIDAAKLSPKARAGYEAARQQIEEMRQAVKERRGNGDAIKAGFRAIGMAGKTFAVELFDDVTNIPRAESSLKAAGRLSRHFTPDPGTKVLLNGMLDKDELTTQRLKTDPNNPSRLDVKGTAQGLAQDAPNLALKAIGVATLSGNLTATQAAAARLGVQRYETARDVAGDFRALMKEDPSGEKLRQAIAQRPEYFIALAQKDKYITEGQASTMIRAAAAAKIPGEFSKFARDFNIAWNTEAGEFGPSFIGTRGYDSLPGQARMPNPFQSAAWRERQREAREQALPSVRSLVPIPPVAAQPTGSRYR